jgi:hypothetical protein
MDKRIEREKEREKSAMCGEIVLDGKKGRPDIY